MNDNNLSTDGGADIDRFVHWLVDSVQLETTVFHVGQYCGRWQASTSGRSLGSFHLVLHGSCYLHVEGKKPVRLDPRDGVFLLRDLPHFLSPDPVCTGVQPAAQMQALTGPASGATGLACGFFEFHGALSSLIADSLPDCLVLRSDDEPIQALHALFELILAEKPRMPDTPSPLIARLAELMFFYVARHVARRDDIATGLLALARRPEFAPLLERMVHEPARDWSAENMARAAHMSRSSFYKHFSDACGQAPAQFVLLLRMKIAAQRLNGGETVERTAEHVGYSSYAAFSRAFKKVVGAHPGAFRRARHVRDGAPNLPGTHDRVIQTIEHKAKTPATYRPASAQ